LGLIHERTECFAKRSEPLTVVNQFCKGDRQFFFFVTVVDIIYIYKCFVNCF
jgi:hypothetical protein